MWRKTYTVYTEPLRSLWWQTEPRSDRRLSFRPLVCLPSDRFEDSEHTVKLWSILGQQTCTPGPGNVRILLLRIDDQCPTAKVADGKEVHVLVPTELLGCLWSVCCFR